MTFSRDGYVTRSVTGITVLQDQNVQVNAQLSTAIKTLGHVTVRGASQLVQPTVTADTYSVNGQTRCRTSTARRRTRTGSRRSTRCPA